MKASPNARKLLGRLGVCSWSIQPENPGQLVQFLKTIGLSRVQLDLDPFRERPEVWGDAQALFSENAITPVSGMFRCVGEDYTTLDSIRVTGGVVPDATWDQNWANAQQTVKNAARLGIDFVAFHAGFPPHDTSNPVYGRLVERIRKLARLFGAEGITLGCETGQEKAADLKRFLQDVNEPNVAVNFDPANMLLYNNGDPVEALGVVGQWVRGVHVKDANVTKVPGTWGDEVPVGTGQVNWTAFFEKLAEIGFPGHMCFEREAGSQRVEDIRSGRVFVEDLLGE